MATDDHEALVSAPLIRSPCRDDVTVGPIERLIHPRSDSTLSPGFAVFWLERANHDGS